MKQNIKILSFLTSNTKEAAALAVAGVPLRKKDPFIVVRKSKQLPNGQTEKAIQVTYQFEGASTTFGTSARELCDAWEMKTADAELDEIVDRIHELAGVAQNKAAEAGNVEALHLINECKKLIGVLPAALMVFMRHALETRESLAKFVNAEKSKAQGYGDVEKPNGDRMIFPLNISRENLAKLK